MRVAPTDVVEVVDHDVGIVDLDEAERIVSPSAIGAVGAVGAAGSETQTQPSGRPPSAGRDAAAAAAVAKLVASATPELSMVHRDAEDPFFRNRRKSIDSMFTGDGADGVQRSVGITPGKAGEQPGPTLHETSLHAPAIKPDTACVGSEKAGAQAQDPPKMSPRWPMTHLGDIWGFCWDTIPRSSQGVPPDGPTHPLTSPDTSISSDTPRDPQTPKTYSGALGIIAILADCSPAPCQYFC